MLLPPQPVSTVPKRPSASPARSCTARPALAVRFISLPIIIKDIPITSRNMAAIEGRAAGALYQRNGGEPKALNKGI
jgi:hypothetical protein